MLRIEKRKIISVASKIFSISVKYATLLRIYMKAIAIFTWDAIPSIPPFPYFSQCGDHILLKWGKDVKFANFFRPMTFMEQDWWCQSRLFFVGMHWQHNQAESDQKETWIAGHIQALLQILVCLVSVLDFLKVQISDHHKIVSKEH